MVLFDRLITAVLPEMDIFVDALVAPNLLPFAFQAGGNSSPGTLVGLNGLRNTHTHSTHSSSAS